MFADLNEAVSKGMAVAFHAAARPDHLALATAYGDRTFRALNARANQLARLLARHGIGTGGEEAAIAVVVGAGANASQRGI